MRAEDTTKRSRRKLLLVGGTAAALAISVAVAIPLLLRYGKTTHQSTTSSIEKQTSEQEDSSPSSLSTPQSGIVTVSPTTISPTKSTTATTTLPPSLEPSQRPRSNDTILNFPTSSPSISDYPTSVPTLRPSAQPTSVISEIPTSAPTTTTQTPTPAPTYIVPEDETFRLKMLWEDGYTWQTEKFETWWCLECAECDFLNFDDNEATCNIRDQCYAGDQIWIRDCRPGNSTGFFFHLKHIYEEDEDFNEFNNFTVSIFHMIQVESSYANTTTDDPLCLQRTERRYVTAEICNESNIAQHWAGFNDENYFDIRPRDFKYGELDTRCLTQQHEPKEFEIVGMKPCWLAHKWDTGNWELF